MRSGRSVVIDFPRLHSRILLLPFPRSSENLVAEKREMTANDILRISRQRSLHREREMSRTAQIDVFFSGAIQSIIAYRTVASETFLL